MILEALSLPFFQNAVLIALLASIVCGVVGTYVVVKNISSISGGLSHAAFGGVGAGYWLGFDPMLGAMVFSLLVGAGLGVAYHHAKSSLDSLISMVWSVGMALGILFVSLSPGYAPDLMSYLFGSILFVSPKMVYWVAALDIGMLLLVFLLFKELQAVVFDEEQAMLQGVPVEFVFQLLLALTALTVVVLVRVVGIILVIALLTIPAAIARQWAESLGKMMLLATALSAFSSVLGLFLAYWLSDRFSWNVPTGPLIILLATVIYCISSLFSYWRRRT